MWKQEFLKSIYLLKNPKLYDIFEIVLFKPKIMQ